MLMPKPPSHEVFAFLHVPKTAGTSFEAGLKACFGDSRVFADYGFTSRTSTFIREFVYKDRPPASDAAGRMRRAREIREARSALLEYLVTEMDSGPVFICGHLAYPAYPFRRFDVPVLAFLRDPVDRVLSFYVHRRRHNDEQRSPRRFVIEEDQTKDLQSRMLRGIGVSELSFVGITERYDDCVELVNQQMGWDIPLLQRRRSHDRPPDLAPLGPDLRDLILSRNERDLKLYRTARELVEVRLAAATIGPRSDLQAAPR